MKHLGLLVFWLMTYQWLVSQQRPQFTQFMLNKYYENPAYGGLERSLAINAIYRDQYSNLNGHPRTFYVGADMPFYLWNGAIGFSLYNQKAGVFNNTNLKFSYNYVMGTQVGFLSFGGRIGFDMLNVDGYAITTPDGDYVGQYTHNDPILATNTFSGIGLSWEIGTYFMGKNIELGLSVNDIPSHSYQLGTGNFGKSFASSFFAQYKYDLNRDIQFLPSILIKSDVVVTQIDAAILAKYQESIFGGFSFRGYGANSIDAFTMIVGTWLGPKYKVSYSYDFGLSTLAQVHQGTHEILLSYNLQKLIGIGLPPKIIYNPRDL